MNILVTYDVNTETPAGRSRLRKVAKACLGFGQRVQLSVFECSLSAENLHRLRARLLKIIDVEQDSLRIYTLHGKREEVVEVHGRDMYTDFRVPLII
ncbi:MAG TPA: CRISPR-associated endonuclease Cas2 [Chthonomonadales bacterium]|nr:CRISPR-associated endonuclease Cas2 [Chthonomonadales bacterium]